MDEFSSQISPAVVEACRAGAAEASEALTRSLDLKLTLAVGEASAWNPVAQAAELAGPGLMVVLRVGTAAALVILPESSKLLPAWYVEPDATGASKLATLGQELGMLLLPEQFMPDGFEAAHVANLAAAIERGHVADGASVVSLNLTAADGRLGTLSLIWPAQSPSHVLAPAAPAEQPAAAPVPAPKPAAPKATAAPAPQIVGVEELPSYSRSLLKIKVPVMVTLASKKQTVSKIVELVPGALIQFDKSCEEMLELEVGGRRVAHGECVKVGDKFGLRITSLIMPDERFHAIRAGDPQIMQFAG